ncbi:uncharacterized protein TRIADDRAFT_55564 [Trichoplax adhaerens]|uniref:AN1-type domain-containing protein n=1 Tax=Trichoplax adhaerens TaxID=10228 RepID=B3RV86_TRIAD|nr:hypothetical protein TRIADDRAFT_55564 [Trichoplax adhaerens]EDV25460.1 hypothetical protein TRIADDRAFT_55564 [Trichoplax adhaerens]|eukprot:XP_002111493.1 hypothetical protein TRIADDRAFT_55564 [Trichoplax adhaerens]
MSVQVDNVLETLPSQLLSESKCSMNDCNQISTVWVECEDCKKLFCLKHRNQLDHNCINLKKDNKIQIKPQINVNTNTGTNKRKGPMSEKGKKTATIISAMKLKMKATGSSSIPQEERLYFNIVLPDGQKIPMFFSSKWAGGKVLDNILYHRKTLGSNSKGIGTKSLSFDCNCA